MSAVEAKDGVIGRRVYGWRYWVLRFSLKEKRGPLVRPPSIRSEKRSMEHFAWIGRIGQGDQRLRCG